MKKPIQTKATPMAGFSAKAPKPAPVKPVAKSPAKAPPFMFGKPPTPPKGAMPMKPPILDLSKLNSVKNAAKPIAKPKGKVK